MLEKLKNLDNELKDNVNDLYPRLKKFVEFTLIYNENCDAGTVLFDEHDQYCIERCLSIIEDVNNNCVE